MSLYGALFAGVSGLGAQSQALGMISDNIANVNTVGYKTRKASFSTLVTRQTANYHSPGGVRSSPVSAVSQQGLLQGTSSATDLALSGDGFFVVTQSPNAGSGDTRFYTRAGQFSTDAAGYLKTPAGQYLQGWVTDSSGNPIATNTSVLSSLETVRVSTVSGSAVATDEVEIGANLPASAAVGATENTNVQIFDSLGVAHDVTFTWTKTAANAWTATVGIPDATTTDGFENDASGANPFSVDIVFNSDGTPLSFDGSTTPPDLFIDGWSSGAASSTIALDWGTAGASGTAQADGLTQFSSTYSTTFANQNGVQFGNFVGVSVNEDGLVTALFDNGENLPIYKIPVVTFANPDGLDAHTGTVFTQSENSGDFFLRSAGEANAGKIIPSSLEASTTDLANEFTGMIVAQRSYSAATKVITTASDMLEELIRVI